MKYSSTDYQRCNASSEDGEYTTANEEKKDRNRSFSSIKYGLLDHLNYLRSVRPEFETLAAALHIDSLKYVSITEATIMVSGNFSKHDATHSRNVISYIEQLLGEAQIRLLSPTDTWMLLTAAYAHDIGMYFPHEEISKTWNSNEFTEYLLKCLKTEDYEVRKRTSLFIKPTGQRRTICEALIETKAEAGNMEAILFLAEKMHVLLSDFRRSRHGEISSNYINNPEYTGTKNGIQNRLYGLVAKCVYAHTISFENALSILPEEADGYYFDYAHPRFVAMLLRMGDLLDIDNGRFNEYVLNSLSEIPLFSRIHRLKHECISQILVRPNKIEVCSDLTPLLGVACTNEIISTFEETNKWFNWIDVELKKWREYSNSFIPFGFFLRLPILTKREILIDGVPCSKEDIVEKFSIDYKRAFEIIGNRGFYSKPLAFVRELVQNAFDAIKFQLLNEEKYEKLENSNSIMETFTDSLRLLTDKHISLDIIRINMPNEAGFKVLFLVKDNGEGLGSNSFKRLRSVGERSTERPFVKGKMFGWLRSTGEFGIGVHSAFAYADELRFRSFNENEGCRLQLLLYSQQKRPGCVINLPDCLCDASPRKKRGTDVWLYVDDDILIDTLYSKDSSRKSNIDADDLFDRLSGSIFKMFAPNIVPLTINFGEADEGISITDILDYSNIRTYKKTLTIPALFLLPNPCKDDKAVNKYTLVGDCIISRSIDGGGYDILFLNSDNPKNIDNRNILIRLSAAESKESTKIAFKGSWVSDSGGDLLSIQGINCELFILGHSACKTITSQRDSILPEAITPIYNDVRRALYYFIIYLSEHLNEAKNFVEGASRTAASVILYAWCLIYEHNCLGDKDNTFKKLIDENKLLKLVKELLDKTALPYDSFCYNYVAGTVTRNDSNSGFRELLQSPTDQLYLLFSPTNMFSAEVKDSSFSNTENNPGIGDDGSDVLRKLWKLDIGKYDPKLVIEQMDMLLMDDKYLKNTSGIYVPVVKLTTVPVTAIEANEKAVDLFLKRWLTDEQNRIKGNDYKYYAYIPAFKQFEELSVEECDYNTSETWRLCKRFIRMPQPQFKPAEIDGKSFSDEYFERCSRLIDDLVLKTSRAKEFAGEKKVDKEIIRNAYERLIDRMRSLHCLDAFVIEPDKMAPGY